MPVEPVELLLATDALLAQMSAARISSSRELETMRRGMVRDIRADMRDGLNRMGTAKIGRTRVLVPSARNLAEANLVATRTRQRMSAFRSRYLNADQARAAVTAGLLPQDPREFIRHSQRLHRHSKEFLERLGELEPELQEDINATLSEMNDNRLDLIKLETKSFTRSGETLGRLVNGRVTRGAASAAIDKYDINRQLWNQSLLEHPVASTRQLLANAADKMASRVATTVSQVPSRAHVIVGVPRDVMSRMGPSSRTAEIGWRLFSAEELDRRYATQVIGRAGPQAISTRRGLGLGPGTEEWYIPVPPETVGPQLTALLAERRAAMLAQVETQRAAAAATR